MSEPFLGQIMMVGFDFPPRGWAICDGQLLPISQNQSLYSLLGTTYGGDGRTTFALPDLRGRVPVHFGPEIGLGDRVGEETHVLTEAEMPAHHHAVSASALPPQEDEPGGNYWAQSDGQSGYASAGDGAMGANAVSTTGANQGHENMQPYLTINFVIALQGIFPSRN
jgi:microcystin-dependent protein